MVMIGSTSAQVVEEVKGELSIVFWVIYWLCLIILTLWYLAGYVF